MLKFVLIYAIVAIIAAAVSRSFFNNDNEDSALFGCFWPLMLFCGIMFLLYLPIHITYTLLVKLFDYIKLKYDK